MDRRIFAKAEGGSNQPIDYLSEKTTAQFLLKNWTP